MFTKNTTCSQSTSLVVKFFSNSTQMRLSRMQDPSRIIEISCKEIWLVLDERNIFLRAPENELHVGFETVFKCFLGYVR